LGNLLKLKTTRFKQSRAIDTPSLNELMTCFESDRGRVLNSAAVRRLQQKTQVFPLEKNSAVRSRLTHSLEVMQVGRFIVQRICQDKSDLTAQLTHKQALASELHEYERALESLVEMACVLHDVGNPPFGHFGEHAISHWFANNAKALYFTHNACVLNEAEESLFTDAEHFEGNAQAIRLVHSLMDLNLSYPLIASILKYTRCGNIARTSCDPSLDYLQKKVGYYYSEQEIVQAVQGSLGIALGHRHPAAYIMEAADDISYCMADLEDAVEKEILSINILCDALQAEFAKVLTKFGISAKTLSETEQKTAFEAYLQAVKIDELKYSDLPDEHKMAFLCQQALQAYKNEDIRKENAFFVSFRVAIVHPLVIHAKNRFLANIDEVLEGNFNAALLEDQSVAHALSQTLKNVALKHAFCHKEVETLELQGYKVINSLLDTFSCLLRLPAANFAQICREANYHHPIESRLIKRIGKKSIATYLKSLHSLPATSEASHSVLEFYYRCRLLQDHISGMTDQFALDEYLSLNALA